MSRSTAGPADASAGYIRGGAGERIDSGTVLRVTFGCCLALLGVLALALTIGGARHNAHDRGLQRNGVAVEATVTSCVGQATGTGITVNGFTCHASFVLDGHRYNDVVDGNTALLAAGTTLRAVTRPDSPSTLSTARAVVVASPSWRRLSWPVALDAVVLLIAVGAWWRWDIRRPSAEGGDGESFGRCRRVGAQ